MGSCQAFTRIVIEQTVTDRVRCPAPRLPIAFPQWLSHATWSGMCWLALRPVWPGTGWVGTSRHDRRSSETGQSEGISPDRRHHLTGASSATAFSSQSTGSVLSDKERSGVSSASMTTLAGLGAASAGIEPVSVMFTSTSSEAVGVEGTADSFDFFQGGQPARPTIG